MSVWIRLSNGREELIVNPDHIQRLIDNGGVIIPDPRIPVEQVDIDESVVVEEQVEPTTTDNEQAVEEKPTRKRGRQAKQ